MSVTSAKSVEVGQEYLACKPTRSRPGEHYARIRVIHAGLFDDSKVLVATVHHDQHGRESLDRRRLISARQLHADPNRRTGYRLIQNPDGSAA